MADVKEGLGLLSNQLVLELDRSQVQQQSEREELEEASVKADDVPVVISDDNADDATTTCFAEWACVDDDLFSESTRIAQNNKQSSSAPRRPRPNWGIPTFQEQCNGVNTFTLCQLDDNGQQQQTSDDDQGSCCCNSVTVTLEHRLHSTGSDLWEAALVLAHALDRSMVDKTTTTTTTLWRNAQSVIELGSGTGALGLYVARVLGAQHVLLTDLGPNLDLLRRNLDLNTTTTPNNGRVEIMALDWTDSSLPQDIIEWQKRTAPCGVDLILGSDLFLPFAAHLLDPLAQTLRDVLTELGHAETQVLLAYEERFDCSDFFTLATQQYGLSIERIDDAYLHPIYRDPGRIFVLRIQLLSEK